MEQYELNWKNYYEILQVSPNAKLSEIKEAYKRLARLYHPDTATDPADAGNMVELNEAYEVLSSDIRRAIYNQVFIARNVQQKLSALEPLQRDLSSLVVVVKEASSGRKRQQIIDELEEQGLSSDLAEQIVEEVFESRTKVGRKEGGAFIGCGIFALLLGGVLAGIFYTITLSSSLYISNSIVVCLLVFGLACLICGLYKNRFTR